MKLELPDKHRYRPASDDQTLGLINVAFLLLVFFLMAGTLTPAEPFDLDALLIASGEPGKAGSDQLLVAADGRIGYRGTVHTLEALSAEMFAPLDGVLTVRADPELNARTMLGVIAKLRQLGVRDIRLVGLPIVTS